MAHSANTQRVHLDKAVQFDHKLLNLLRRMANEGVHNAAYGMSGMVGQTLAVSEPNVHLVPFCEITNLAGGPENEAVGIYLRAEGGLSGQIMLIIPYQKALELVDMMMEQPSGATQHLGALERSALAELGNLTASFFLNAIVAMTGKDTLPSPPAVMVDMVGAILSVIIAGSGGISENVLMIEAVYKIGDRATGVSFWVVPDQKTLLAVQNGPNAASQL
jgi:chemotaxis protein CheC